jgi:hypothetical protein
LRFLLALLALVGFLVGAERLWRRSEHFRKQPALCAFFEMKEILTPAIEFTRRWGLSDSVVLVHGLALEDKASDADPLAASVPA